MLNPQVSIVVPCSHSFYIIIFYVTEMEGRSTKITHMCRLLDSKTNMSFDRNVCCHGLTVAPLTSHLHHRIYLAQKRSLNLLRNTPSKIEDFTRYKGLPLKIINNSIEKAIESLL